MYIGKETIKAIKDVLTLVANATGSFIIMTSTKGHYDDVRRQGDALISACNKLAKMTEDKVEWYYAHNHKPVV